MDGRSGHVGPIPCLSEVLEVMDEVWQLPALVHFFARRHHTLRQRPRPAAEYADFAHLQSDAKDGVCFFF